MRKFQGHAKKNAMKIISFSSCIDVAYTWCQYQISMYVKIERSFLNFNRTTTINKEEKTKLRMYANSFQNELICCNLLFF